MRCLSPRKASLTHSGSVTFSLKQFNRELVPFQLPCGKCIECRLEHARETAIRCVHEASCYENNIFLTLTYSDEHVPQKLHKRDFQLFMKSLRNEIFKDFIQKFGKYNWSLLSKKERKEVFAPHKIGVLYVGEYGEKTKRPHWHAIIFNYSPTDKTPKYTTSSGEKVFTSETIDALWNKGRTELGSVTFESAGYVARYSAKKLVHGKDNEHDFNPVVGRSNHSAIGKRWLEKYHDDVFNYGHIVLPNGKTCSIPRYYQKWLAKNEPQKFLDYISDVKSEKIKQATIKTEKENHETLLTNHKRYQQGNYTPQVTKQQARREIQEQKFKQLQKHLKGDI